MANSVILVNRASGIYHQTTHLDVSPVAVPVLEQLVPSWPVITKLVSVCADHMPVEDSVTLVWMEPTIFRTTMPLVAKTVIVMLVALWITCVTRILVPAAVDHV